MYTEMASCDRPNTEMMMCMEARRPTVYVLPHLDLFYSQRCSQHCGCKVTASSTKRRDGPCKLTLPLADSLRTLPAALYYGLSLWLII